MSKRSEFVFNSATINPKESIKAGFDLATGNWEAVQDVSQYKKHAQLEKEKQEYFGLNKNKSGFRKMATIPDIVAIKIKEDHGIDLHSTTFMRDKDRMKKLKYILKTEYPELLINS